MTKEHKLYELTKQLVYPKEEAVPYCKNDLDLTCVPINNSEHNEKY